VLLEFATPKMQAEVPAQPALQAGTKYFWSYAARAGRRRQNGAYRRKTQRSLVFQLAVPADEEAARGELLQIAAALQQAPEDTRRAAQAAALAERGLYSAAIGQLTRRTLETRSAAGGGGCVCASTIRSSPRSMMRRAGNCAAYISTPTNRTGRAYCARQPWPEGTYCDS